MEPRGRRLSGSNFDLSQFRVLSVAAVHPQKSSVSYKDHLASANSLCQTASLDRLPPLHSKQQQPRRLRLGDGNGGQRRKVEALDLGFGEELTYTKTDRMGFTVTQKKRPRGCRRHQEEEKRFISAVDRYTRGHMQNELAPRSLIEAYIQSFDDEREIFQSASIFATTKLDEAAQLAASGLMPDEVLSAVCGHLLLREAARGHGPLSAHRQALAVALRAVFALPHTEKHLLFSNKSSRVIVTEMSLQSRVRQDALESGGPSLRDERILTRGRSKAAALAAHLKHFSATKKADSVVLLKHEGTSAVGLSSLVETPTWGVLRPTLETRMAAEIELKTAVDSRLVMLEREIEQLTELIEHMCGRSNSILVGTIFARWQTYARTLQRRELVATRHAASCQRATLDAPRRHFHAWRAIAVERLRLKPRAHVSDAESRKRDLMWKLTAQKARIDALSARHLGIVSGKEFYESALGDYRLAASRPEFDLEALESSTSALCSALESGILGAKALSKKLAPTDFNTTPAALDAPALAKLRPNHVLEANFVAWAPGLNVPEEPPTEEKQAEVTSREDAGPSPFDLNCGKLVLAWVNRLIRKDAFERRENPVKIDGRLDEMLGCPRNISDGVALARLARQLHQEHSHGPSPALSRLCDAVIVAKKPDLVMTAPQSALASLSIMRGGCYFAPPVGRHLNLDHLVGRFLAKEYWHHRDKRKGAEDAVEMRQSGRDKVIDSYQGFLQKGGAKAGVALTTNVVMTTTRVVTRYLGKRVVLDREKHSIACLYALFAELFATHGLRPSQDKRERQSDPAGMTCPHKALDLIDGALESDPGQFYEKDELYALHHHRHHVMAWQPSHALSCEVESIFADGVSRLRGIANIDFTEVSWAEIEMQLQRLVDVGEALACFAESSVNNGEVTQRRRHTTAAIDESVRLAWRSCCTTVLGTRTRVEEDVDDGSFTKIRLARLRDVFKRNGVSEEDEQGELDELEIELRSFLRDLKRVFVFYAASSGDGSSSRMGQQEFWRFVRDCKLQDKARKYLPSSTVDVLYNTFVHTKGGVEQQDDGELGHLDFSEICIAIACARFRFGRPRDRLRKLITEHMLPNACQLDTDIFHERLCSNSVKLMLLKHKRPLKAIFANFSSVNLNTLSSDALVVIMRDAKIVGPLLSEAYIRCIFAYVQNDDADDDAEVKSKTGFKNVVTNDDDQMVFSEFQEAVAAVAAMIEPDPYKQLDQSIDRFVTERLIPPLAHQYPLLRSALGKQDKQSR